jgi:hypothetical protein
MIGTQSRLPCRDAQLGEAVLLKIPVSSLKFQLKMAYSWGKRTRRGMMARSVLFFLTGNDVSYLIHTL